MAFMVYTPLPVFHPEYETAAEMEQIFEFIGNHYILVTIFVALLFAFLVSEGRQGGVTVNTSMLVNLVNREDAKVLDVRDNKDFKAGHIASAVNIPFSALDSRMKELESHKAKPVIVVCKIGQHSKAAGKKLKDAGYEDVRRLSGGMSEWSAASLPVVKA